MCPVACFGLQTTNFEGLSRWQAPPLASVPVGQSKYLLDRRRLHCWA